MKWKLQSEVIAVSECGKLAVVKNAADLYTPWALHGGTWLHIDGRGCDTAKEAAQVCERHSQQQARAG